jgi:hypothetical protein
MSGILFGKCSAERLRAFVQRFSAFDPARPLPCALNRPINILRGCLRTKRQSLSINRAAASRS